MLISRVVLHQSLASSTVLLNELIVGLIWGWPAPVLVKLQRGECDFSASEEETSWIASISEIGRLFAPIISAFFLDKVGRQKSVIFIALCFSTSFLPIIFVQNIWAVLCVRLIVGMVNGISDVVSSIYLAENLAPKMRGVVGSIVTIFYYGGIFIEYTLGTYLSYTYLALVNSIMCLCVVPAIFFVKETPYFDILKGRYDRAEENLMWLQGGGKKGNKEKILLELDQIKKNLELEKAKKKSTKELLSSPENVKTILMVFGIYAITSATGYTAVTIYTTLIFVPSDYLTSEEFTMIFGIVQFLVVCMAPFVVEKFNRRTLIIGCFLVSTVSHACTSILFKLNSMGYDIPCYPWLIFVSVTLYGAISAFIYPVLYILRGELFPMSVKALGSSLAILVQSAASFGVAKVFLLMNNNFGIESNFIFYFFMSLTTVLYTYFIIPETRGKTLVAIQESLK